MVTRCGHSLPELLVTLAFLGATLGAIASGTVAATRATVEAVRRQHGLTAAAAALDSLLAAPDPRPASRRDAGLLVAWTVAPEGAGRVIHVRALRPGSGSELAALDGFWIPLPALLVPGGT